MRRAGATQGMEMDECNVDARKSATPKLFARFKPKFLEVPMDGCLPGGCLALLLRRKCQSVSGKDKVQLEKMRDSDGSRTTCDTEGIGEDGVHLPRRLTQDFDSVFEEAAAGSSSDEGAKGPALKQIALQKRMDAVLYGHLEQAFHGRAPRGYDGDRDGGDGDGDSDSESAESSVWFIYNHSELPEGGYGKGTAHWLPKWRQQEIDAALDMMRFLRDDADAESVPVRRCEFHPLKPLT